MIHASVIQEYAKKDNAYLKRKARETFNAWIRWRDRLMIPAFKCITCGETKVIQGKNYQACHYYSSGEYPGLRFNEDNVHGGCLRCNHFAGDQLIRYRENLIKKIGFERVKQLDLLAAIDRNRKKVWGRNELIMIIEKYKLI